MTLLIPIIKDRSELPADLEKSHEMIMMQNSHIVALAASVEALRKQVYGPRSEKVRTGEGQDDFLADAAVETTEQASRQGKTKSAPSQGHGRRVIPAEIPRRNVEHDVTPEEKICSCGRTKVRIGEEVSEQLDFVPAQLEVIRNVRPKYACPGCRDSVVTAAMPSQPVAKGLAAPGLLANVIISKYGDHIPLTRQERIFARHGIDFSRTTLCDWVMQCADLVKPVITRMHSQVLQSRVVHSDDTPVPVLAKDHTHRSYLWVYVGDNAHPCTVYDFTWTRNRAGPSAFLSGFSGYLQADAYSGYDELYRNGAMEVACWAHARRRFVEASTTDTVHAPVAIERIGALYGVERDCKDMSCDERRAAREQQSKTLLADLFAWMEDTIMRVLPKSPTGEALAYALTNRTALERYVEDGRIDIDNNEAERALRSVVVGRKNWMFAGNERGGKAAATFFTLVETARRNDINLFNWLRDMLTRLPDHSILRVDEFLPHNWKQLNPDLA